MSLIYGNFDVIVTLIITNFRQSLSKYLSCGGHFSKFLFYFIYLFIYYFPTIKITQALHYTKMWRGDLRKPQGLYEEAPSLQ